MVPVPFDRLYPKENISLFREVCRRGGTIISIDTKSSQKKFLERNKFMVGMADIVLIVHASKRSGSSQTARMALKQGLPLYCVPGSEFCDEFLKLEQVKELRARDKSKI